jgi:hypothetical protein
VYTGYMSRYESGLFGTSEQVAITSCSDLLFGLPFEQL